MTTTAMTGRVWEGAFRTPRNAFADAKGSIHNDDTAAKLGFKGGTVAGSVHMDQFVPALLEAYGDDWWRSGSLSLYFTQATVDGEPVRATVEAGADRARLSMFNEAGALICKGTAAAGADEGSELRTRFAEQAAVEPAALRILKNLRVGDEHRGLEVCVPGEALERALATLTEPLDVYRKGVLPPSHAVRLAHMTRPVVMEKAAYPHVGLFGGLEVRHLTGPLRADVAYRARTKILKLTESPKTENVWYEVTFSEAGREAEVASVFYLLRIMRASSPLYAAAG